MVCRIKRPEKTELNFCRRLLRGDPYCLFRNYRPVDRYAYAGHVLGQIRGGCAGKGYLLFSRESDKSRGLIYGVFSRWDTDYFHLPTAKIECLTSTGDYERSRQVKTELLSAFLKAGQKEGIRYVMAKIDAEDSSSLHAAEEMGFRLMATQLVGITDRDSMLNCRNVDGPSVSLREFKRRDRKMILRIAEEVSSGLNSHLDLSPYLPPQRRKKYYIESAMNCCRGKCADGMYVAEKKGKVIGFYAYKDLDLRGRKGCFAVLSAIDIGERRKKFGLSFHKMVHGELLKGHDFIIGKVYAHNLPMLNLLEKTGNRYITTQHCFHRYLG